MVSLVKCLNLEINLRILQVDFLYKALILRICSFVSALCVIHNQVLLNLEF